MIAPEKHDLVVIGGGPAGLSAALTAEDNGINTLVLDESTLGGQAATATLIENYPGFPQGISGDQLIGNIVDQALKYSTEFQAPTRVTSIRSVDEGILVSTNEERDYLGRFALIAIGQEQRSLAARNLAAYTSRGVTYGSPNRRIAYENQELCVVGGSDAAAQAAVHLSQFPGCNVHLILRNTGLEKRVRKSLIDKVVEQDNIIIHPQTEVTGVDGNGRLEKLVLKDLTGDVSELNADQLFILIGAIPKTAWLPALVARDRQGYVASGTKIDGDDLKRFLELTKGRKPLDHETSIPKLFVAGDVRSGLGKMVTFAIFDGASVIPEIQAADIYNQLHKK